MDRFDGAYSDAARCLNRVEQFGRWVAASSYYSGFLYYDEFPTVDFNGEFLSASKSTPGSDFGLKAWQALLEASCKQIGCAQIRTRSIEVL